MNNIMRDTFSDHLVTTAALLLKTDEDSADAIIEPAHKGVN